MLLFWKIPLESKPNIRYYRDWVKSDNAVFGTELKKDLIRVEILVFKYFEQTFLSLSNLHTPMKIKKKYSNHKLYRTKSLCKAIMKRSELASKYLKITKNTKDYNNYKKQIYSWKAA